MLCVFSITKRLLLHIGYKAGGKLVTYCPQSVYIDSKCFSHREGINQGIWKIYLCYLACFSTILLQAVTSPGEKFFFITMICFPPECLKIIVNFVTKLDQKNSSECWNQHAHYLKEWMNNFLLCILKINFRNSFLSYILHWICFYNNVMHSSSSVK